MKSIQLNICLAAVLLGSGAVFGQDQLPVSRTSGTHTVDLPVNQTTLLALPFVEVIASGTVSSVSGSTIGLSTAPGDVLTLPHAIKITSRSTQTGNNAYGYSAQITGQIGSDVTATLAVSPNVGDEFIIYRLETLGSLFGVNNAVGLRAGSSPASADIVYLDNGAGGLVGYYYRTTTSSWKLVSSSTGPDQPGALILPGRGVLVVRKTGGSPVSIKFSGEEMVGNERVSVVSSAFNLVNNPFTQDATLDDLTGLVQGGSSAAAADVVYLEDSGTLTGYFYRTTTSSWKLLNAATGPDQDDVAIAAGKAILVAKKANAVGFTLLQPFAN